MNRIKHLMKTLSIKIYNFASYRNYYELKTIEVKSKKEKYLKMTDDEFLMIYIEICSLYERKKMMFTVIFVGIIISVIMDAWKYCFNFLQKIFVSKNEIVMGIANEAKIFIMILTGIIIGIAFTVIFVMVRRIYKLNKEKILIEEIKKIRSGE